MYAHNLVHIVLHHARQKVHIMLIFSGILLPDLDTGRLTRQKAEI